MLTSILQKRKHMIVLRKIAFISTYNEKENFLDYRMVYHCRVK